MMVTDMEPVPAQFVTTGELGTVASVEYTDEIRARSDELTATKVTTDTDEGVLPTRLESDVHTDARNPVCIVRSTRELVLLLLLPEAPIPVTLKLPVTGLLRRRVVETLAASWDAAKV